MTPSQRIFWMISTSLFLSLFAGCGDAVPKTIPVTGLVTIDGSPLQQGTVIFMPVESSDDGPSRIATGVVQSDGTFSLSTFANGDGAIIGEYQVAIDARGPISTENFGEEAASAVPSRYASPATSGLTVSVTHEMNACNFELLSGEPR